MIDPDARPQLMARRCLVTGYPKGPGLALVPILRSWRASGSTSGAKNRRAVPRDSVSVSEPTSVLSMRPGSPDAGHRRSGVLVGGGSECWCAAISEQENGGRRAAGEVFGPVDDPPVLGHDENLSTVSVIGDEREDRGHRVVVEDVEGVVEDRRQRLPLSGADAVEVMANTLHGVAGTDDLRALGIPSAAPPLGWHCGS